MKKFIKLHLAHKEVTLYLRIDQIWTVETASEPMYTPISKNLWKKEKKKIHGTIVRTFKHNDGGCYLVKESIDEIMNIIDNPS